MRTLLRSRPHGPWVSTRGRRLTADELIRSQGWLAHELPWQDAGGGDDHNSKWQITIPNTHVQNDLTDPSVYDLPGDSLQWHTGLPGVWGDLDIHGFVDGCYKRSWTTHL